LNFSPTGAPLLVVIAGPNGAGKSTFYQHFFASSSLPFVNADRIAREMAPSAPESVSAAAADLATRERWARVDRGESFIFETVLSDPAGDKVNFLREVMARGYHVVLVFIGLENASLSRARVSERVATGGHSVPGDKIAGRFPRVLANLDAAIPFVDQAYLFDNSDSARVFRFVAHFERGKLVKCSAPIPRWARAVEALSGPRLPSS
jgi:predicted ABC-type ATPase